MTPAGARHGPIDSDHRSRARAFTLYLGSDDEIGETSLSDVDLYDDLPRRLATFTSGGEHPHPFYAACGFRIVGVLPDANGTGKPDIFMARRLMREEP